MYNFVCNFIKKGSSIYYNVFYKTKKTKKEEPMRTLDFSQISRAEKHALLPQDFKDCFWSNLV